MLRSSRVSTALLRFGAIGVVALSLLVLLAGAGVAASHRRLAGASSRGFAGQASVERVPARATSAPLPPTLYLVTSDVERGIVERYIQQHALNALAGTLDDVERLAAAGIEVAVRSSDAVIRAQIEADQYAITRALSGP